jgi:hypothetical protein
MRNLKAVLAVAFVITTLTVITVVTGLTPISGATAREEPLGDHWRNHDGHWSYWHEEDKRWYYTDGTHWFYHDGKGWVLYRFDKHFGKEQFVHGDYKVREGVKIEVPRHEVHRR